MTGVGRAHSTGASARAPEPAILNVNGENMEPAHCDGMPNDVLVVEDDPIIALDFEDTLLGFGVKTVRTAIAKRVLPSPNGWRR